MHSVDIIRSFTDCGYIRPLRKRMLVPLYFNNTFRVFISNLATLALTIFIWTIDGEGSENVLDQIKDFTALVIIIQIDDQLSGILDQEIVGDESVNVI